jgi:hypothetical protein
MPNTPATALPIFARDAAVVHNPVLGGADILFSYIIFKYYNPIENKIAFKDISIAHSHDD